MELRPNCNRLSADLNVNVGLFHNWSPILSDLYPGSTVNMPELSGYKTRLYLPISSLSNTWQNRSVATAHTNKSNYTTQAELMQTQRVYRCWIFQNTKSVIPTSNTKGNAPGAIDSGGASAIAPTQPERCVVSAQAKDRSTVGEWRLTKLTL